MRYFYVNYKSRTEDRYTYGNALISVDSLFDIVQTKQTIADSCKLDVSQVSISWIEINEGEYLLAQSYEGGFMVEEDTQLEGVSSSEEIDQCLE